MTTRKVTIQVDQAGNAKASLGETSQAMRELSRTAKDMQTGYRISTTELIESEKRYQDLLRQRSRIQQEAGRAAQGGGANPFAGMGGGSAAAAQAQPRGGGFAAGLGVTGGDVMKGAQGLMSGGPMAALSGHPAGMAFQAVVQGMEKTAHTLEILNNSTLTAAHKAEKFAEEFIPGGKAVVALRDALTGVAERIRLAEYKFQDVSLAQRQGLEKDLAERQQGAQVEARRHRSAAFAALPAPAAPDAALADTHLGEIQFNRELRRLPLEAEAARAGAAVEAARRDQQASQSHAQKLQGELRSLQEAEKGAEARERAKVAAENAKAGGFSLKQLGRDALDSAVGLPSLVGLGPSQILDRDKAGRSEAGKESLAAQNATLSKTRELRAEINREEERGIALAQAESAQRKANLGLAKEDLAYAQEKLHRLTSQAQRLGSLSEAELRFGSQALDVLKGRNGDLRGLPPQFLASARAVAPEYVAKQEEKYGASREGVQALRDKGFIESGDIRSQREDVAQKAAKVQVNISLDESALAERIAQALERGLGKVIKTLEAKFESERGQLRSGRQIAQSGG